ncbi:B12-binding domain-containing radical SAM protein [Tahibacter soli]|uniref:Radical SAM protein n=1 Tax=Tahibacter soli TaxID=2983605 RepID=A0A9X3YI64_9GAMM|nr:radical SAM protein [Tahibacter soli]MDC8012652.1 radical SAM protein [Tahibacter soli]
MKLVLVDNLVLPDAGDLAMLDVHPHLGLLALAAAAEGDGHRVRIYDPKRLVRTGELPYDETLYARAAETILRESPDAVGFTSLGCSFLFALNVAQRLKRAEPDLPVMLGGPHATMLDRHILERYAPFDVVVRHEADEILPAVLAALPNRAFEAIPGISWRGANGAFRATPGKPIVEDLDRLPLLPYEHYPIAELGLDLLRVEAGRGCPFMCTFCSTATFFQRSFRLKSAERLVRELERLRDAYGYSDFKLDHDMFTVSKRKVREFCEAVRGRGFRWRVSARVDCVNEALLEQMADAGCVGLYFGIETGSARMQKIAKKRLDLDLVAPTLAVTRRVGIATTTSFITGYPEETTDDQDDTLDMIGRCADEGNLAQLHILQPEPGTPMYDELGARIAYDGFSSPFNAYLLNGGDRDLVLGDPGTFQTYYHYPTLLPRARRTFAVQAMDVLRRVGPLVLRYALKRYDDRLSRLVGAWRDASATADAASLLAVVAREFGAHHHVASLFRYGLELHDAQAGGTNAIDARYDARCEYRLAVRVLPAMHDCERWLARIAQAAQGRDLLDDEIDAERVTYLVRAGAERAAAYRVDDGVAAIVGLFDEPRRCADVARALDADIAPAFFERLVALGILAPERAR